MNHEKSLDGMGYSLKFLNEFLFYFELILCFFWHKIPI